ncbi:MAG: glycosyltransferase [Phycisphaerales bacterium]
MCMPFRDRERYLRAAAESVLAQTMGDLELVMFDDGSRDASAEIARELAAEDDRVVLVEGVRESVGFARAEQRCHDAARAAYVGCVDSDDVLEPTALELSLGRMEPDPLLAMVYTDHHEIDERGRRIGPGKRSRRAYSPEALLVDFMTFAFRLVRADVVRAVGGFDASVNFAADYDLCLKVSEVGVIERIDADLYGYRMHEATTSASQRLRQIHDSRIAVERAMARREMTEQFVLSLALKPSFELRGREVARGGEPLRLEPDAWLRGL